MVTGTVNGIGCARAIELARKGMNFVMIDLKEAFLEETAEDEFFKQAFIYSP